MSLYEFVVSFVNVGTQIVVCDYITNQEYFSGRAGYIVTDHYDFNSREVDEVAGDPNYPDILIIAIK